MGQGPAFSPSEHVSGRKVAQEAAARAKHIHTVPGCAPPTPQLCKLVRCSLASRIGNKLQNWVKEEEQDTGLSWMSLSHQEHDLKFRGLQSTPESC